MRWEKRPTKRERPPWLQKHASHEAPEARFVHSARCPWIFFAVSAPRFREGMELLGKGGPDGWRVAAVEISMPTLDGKPTLE